MTSGPKDIPNDIPDMEPLPAPDILPGDPEGMKPVKEPVKDIPQRAKQNCETK